MFEPPATRAKSAPNLASLSRMRKRGVWPYGVGSRELLGDPGIGGMTGHANMNDFSALQLDNEEGKERAKEQVDDRQEVAGPHVVCMVVQEGAPGLSRRAGAWMAHILLDRALGDVNPQFEQFPADTLGSPLTIVAGHGFDQSDGLGRDFGCPRSRFRSLPPEPAECLTMPAEGRIGLNKEERLFPTGSSSCEQHQEDPICPGTRCALHLTSKDDQLLSQHGVFGDEFWPGAGQIVPCSYEEGAARWSRPLQETLLDQTERAPEAALERSEPSSHSSIGSFKKMGEVGDAGKLTCMDFTLMTSGLASRCPSRTSIAGTKC